LKLIAEKVLFYALNQKFLDSDEDVPADAASRQVMYYSLAIGHHVGVIDCFKAIIDCPLEDYRQWMMRLPEGQAKRKMEGLYKFGEITIDRTHTQILRAAFDEIRPELTGKAAEWTDKLSQAFISIEMEPAIYLMVKTR
jgi:hydrogenase-4 component J